MSLRAIAAIAPRSNHGSAERVPVGPKWATNQDFDESFIKEYFGRLARRLSLGVNIVLYAMTH